MRRALPPLLFLASSLSASAGELDFAANQAQSNFTWSGSTSVGPIVGNPSNAFQLAGHQLALLAAGGGPGAKWTGELAGGDLAVVPDLHGKIPNPFPFLPPLATIDVANLHLSLASQPFDVLGDGSFTALVTATALSGTLTVTPLGGSPTVTDLTGSSSTPEAQGGTLAPGGGGLAWTSPIDLTFVFSDPSSGITGTLTTQGSLRADWTPAAPAIYCTAKTTSAGCVPALSVAGTPSASAASGFSILANAVHPQNVGLYFFGRNGPAAQPFQGGVLCVTPPLVRVAPQLAGGAGTCGGTYAVDFNAWLAANAPELRAPGEDFCVQCWFRDPPDPVSGTGLTDAVSFVLAP
jgi:hypothetical protein